MLLAFHGRLVNKLWLSLESHVSEGKYLYNKPHQKTVTLGDNESLHAVFKYEQSYLIVKGKSTYLAKSGFPFIFGFVNSGHVPALLSVEI